MTFDGVLPFVFGLAGVIIPTIDSSRGGYPIFVMTVNSILTFPSTKCASYTLRDSLFFVFQTFTQTMKGFCILLPINYYFA